MDNRAYILEQALRLFSERGYDAVGVQDITLAAGVTKPTLYHYFGSKSGLLQTLMREHCTRLNQQMAEAATYTGYLPDVLERVVATAFRFAQAEPLFYRLYLSSWFALPGNEAHAIVVPFHEALFEIMERLFLEASADHGNMRGRHRAIAVSLLGLIHTYIGISLNGRIELNNELGHQLVRQFSYGIYT